MLICFYPKSSNQKSRAVATIGAWGTMLTQPIGLTPPHQTFGKLKYDDISMMIQLKIRNLSYIL